MKHVFLLDVTRHIGPVQGVIGPAQAYVSEFNPEIVRWFLTTAQKAEDGTSNLDVVEIQGYSALDQVDAAIRSLSSTDGRVFHVLSYDKKVLLAAADMNRPDTVVSQLSLTALPNSGAIRSPVIVHPSSGDFSSAVGNRRPAVAVLRSSTASSPSLSAEEAAVLTRQLLAEGRHDCMDRALHQTQLRPSLVGMSQGRARRNSDDVRSVSLISDVVKIGLTEGWLEQFTLDGKSGTERIYLKAPIQAGAQTPAVKASGVQTDVVSRSRARTTEFIKCLKDRYIYSPKDIRDLFFAALKERSAELAKEPTKAGKLIHITMTQAQEGAQKEGIEFQFWLPAADAILEMMLAAGVLIGADGKTAIPPSAHARAEQVSSIASDFVDKCEKFLLEYLISTKGNVTVRDRTAIAHALFKVSPEKKQVFELPERVDELLMLLRDRISQRSDGQLALDKLA